jgi:hypothetical protein
LFAGFAGQLFAGFAGQLFAGFAGRLSACRPVVRPRRRA